MLSNNMVSLKNRVSYNYNDKRIIEEVKRSNMLNDDYTDITFKKTINKNIVVVDNNTHIKTISGENYNIIDKLCIIDSKIVKIKEIRYEVIGGRLDD